ncbi:hypothetical protein GGS23DRAFT_595558 [Durotheca rogersii]|uniref:uncharacterized protein n=1 Tax=Durotheca rogersii TaxID=419775 RepID=UPI00221FF339|nr:uncharacterized protein GGS23DRAFT_595558 [Durotheca rogersii]KAI5864865.1 hypothetical protein GGS23DRAFT_595558 [Durotheca rogersii]
MARAFALSTAGPSADSPAVTSVPDRRGLHLERFELFRQYSWSVGSRDAPAPPSLPPQHGLATSESCFMDIGMTHSARFRTIDLA